MSNDVIAEKGLAKRMRVWNRGSKAFKYEVLGESYDIAPGAFKEVPRRTGIAMRGFYPGKNVEVNLQLEPVVGEYDEPQPEAVMNKEKVVVYSCYKCEEEFNDKIGLSAHMKEKHTPGRKAN